MTGKGERMRKRERERVENESGFSDNALCSPRCSWSQSGYIDSFRGTASHIQWAVIGGSGATVPNKRVVYTMKCQCININIVYSK